jgi:hypothetical protein
MHAPPRICTFAAVRAMVLFARSKSGTTNRLATMPPLVALRKTDFATSLM